MPFDGTFIHYLLNEIKPKINKGIINKIHQISSFEFIFIVRANFTNYSLYINVGPQNSRFHLTDKKYDNPIQPYNFCMLLRKYLERGIIENIEQFGNDRQICFTINSYNDLDDNVIYKLFIELTGKSSNLILTNSSNLIIDVVRKVPPVNELTRTLLPKAQYEIMKSAKINPFIANSDTYFEDLEGCSKDLIKEFSFQFDNFQNNFKTIINQEIKPVVYQNNKRTYYAYPLKHLSDDFITYPTLSSLLDDYFINNKTETNSEFSYIEKVIKREITKKKNKLINLNDDLENAKSHLQDNDIGILLQSNLYLVKPKSSSITVENFLNHNEEITIILDPLLSPSDNLKHYFKNAAKAKNALKEVNNQLTITKDEIDYLEGIYYQLPFLTSLELEEVKRELAKNHILHKYQSKNKQSKRINLLTYNIDGIDIIIGKNNLQNDYLSNKLAKPNDTWFHVKDLPGSHVIVRGNNLTEEIIRFASNAAACFSKAYASSSVPVDYTLVKNLKKIPRTKGYHLTYSTNKTIYIDPDQKLLNSKKAIYR